MDEHCRWDQPGIPHRGWTYIDVEDVFPVLEECEMCGYPELRYVHILRHPEYGTIRVGCVCAKALLQGYADPAAREKTLKNRGKRLETFCKREWTYKPDTGNFTLRYKGVFLTLMKSRYGPGWGIICRGRSCWAYQGQPIRGWNSAKRAAFDLFEATADQP